MRHRARSVDTEDPDHNDKIKFARQTRRIIGWIAGGLAFVFGFLQLKDIHVDTVLTNSNPDILWHIALAGYYFSWVRGTLNDTDIQELAYTKFPTGEKWPLRAIAVVGVLFLTAIALCWAEGNIQRFAALLLIFTLVDHILWRYLIDYLQPARIASENTHRQHLDFFGLEVLSEVTGQVQGNWKWYRFFAGLLVLAVICGFAYWGAMQGKFIEIASSVVQGLRQDELASLIGCTLVIIWMILMEGWHWAMRLRTRTAINLIEDLRVKYALEPR